MPTFVPETASPRFTPEAPKFTPDLALAVDDAGAASLVPRTPSFTPATEAYEPGLAEKIGLAIKQANEDPLGSFSGSVATILTKLGVMDETSANKLARDINAGIASLGPLGAEFVGAPSIARRGATPKIGETVADARSASPGPAVRRPAEAPETPRGSPDDFAGNINLNRIFAPEDVKQVIQETAAQNADFIAARRGVIPQEETRTLARLVGMTPEKLSARVKGQALNAEEMFAARELLVGQATRVRELARQAFGGSDLDKAAFAEEMTRLVAIQEHVAGATAEAGRALSQFRMMAGASKEEIARLVDASRSSGLDDMIEGVRRLDNAAPEDVAAFVREAFKAKGTDKVFEAWINWGLLSGPTTHAVNILSNSLVSALSIPEALISAGISKITGSGIAAREVVSRVVGTAEGAKEGLRAALRAFRTEDPLFETSKIDVGKMRAIPSVTLRKGAKPKQVAGVDIPFTGEIELGGKQVRLPGRMLTAEDAFFKSIAYRQEVNALATRQALGENLAGHPLAERIAELRANPPAEITEAAREAAMKRTFTNPLGPGAKHIQGLAREWPIVRVIVPFIRTPTNIVKFAAERSPFAPFVKEAREALLGKNGPAARDEAIARVTLGSSIGMTAAYLASEGLVTGGGPVDPRKRALLYQSGWQPYSVRVGDTYYSYGRLEPLGMLFGIAADFTELAHVATEEEAKGLAALIAGSVASNLTSKTWLRGLSDAMEAFNDFDRYGQRWIMGLAGTVIPTGAAQWARSQDPYLRDARSILDKIRERLPGYRETLPFRRDLFGEPIKLEGGIGPDIVSPAYVSTAQDDPTIAEMLRLGVTPGRPTRFIRGVELNAEQYDALQVATGQSARKLLSILVGSPSWKQVPDDLKKDAIADAFRQARDVGRAATVARFPDLANAIFQQQETAQ